MVSSEIESPKVEEVDEGGGVIRLSIFDIQRPILFVDMVYKFIIRSTFSTSSGVSMQWLSYEVSAILIL